MAMTFAIDTLNVTEAAYVSDVPRRDVDRAIDERIIPEEFVELESGRRMRSEACILISFYSGTAGSLTAEERLDTIRVVSSRIVGWNDFNTKVTRRFFTIDFAPFISRTYSRLETLAEARAAVVSDPEILGGEPVLKGTRVLVYDVAASLKSGIRPAELVTDFPSLDLGKVELARIYADTNPRRGRSRKISWRDLGQTEVSNADDSTPSSDGLLGGP